MKNYFIFGMVLGLLGGCGESDSHTGPAVDSQPVVVRSAQNENHQLEALENGVEKEDFDATLRAFNVLKGSTNSAVRLRCVESIGWFGGKSAKVLEPFLRDPSEDVRSEAQDQWDSALNDIEDEHEKGLLIESAMTLVRDREIMDTVATQLNDLTPSLAIDIIVHVIQGSNGVARVAAKEAYEYVTGDDWKSAAAAQKWLEENQEEDDEE